VSDLDPMAARRTRYNTQVASLAEAAENIGRGVVYVPEHGAREDGKIVRVNDHYVMVSYKGKVKATRVEDLVWLWNPPTDNPEEK
jgi:hypothetical protein